MRKSLEKRLSIMNLSRVDLFVLHSNIVPEGYRLDIPEHIQDRVATPLPVFQNQVVPAFKALRAEGLIGHWGITGVGLPQTIMEVLRADVRPGVTQCIANLSDSPGGMARFSEPAQPRDVIRTAQENGVGVLGIRAVQAGALTDAIDREMPNDDPEMQDFQRPAPFRDIAKEVGESPASLAHRYALSMDGVDSVILGVKNRVELEECIDAEAAGPLDRELMERIDAAVGRQNGRAIENQQQTVPLAMPCSTRLCPGAVDSRTHFQVGRQSTLSAQQCGRLDPRNKLRLARL